MYKYVLSFPFFAIDSAGTRTKGVVRCDQPRPIDLSARKARKLETVPDAIIDDVLARIVALFSPQ